METTGPTPTFAAAAGTPYAAEAAAETYRAGGNAADAAVAAAAGHGHTALVIGRVVEDGGPERVVFE
jgi:gamma-glutamyltranspeptidase/glutathione hydrolase